MPAGSSGKHRRFYRDATNLDATSTRVVLLLRCLLALAGRRWNLQVALVDRLPGLDNLAISRCGLGARCSWETEPNRVFPLTRKAQSYDKNYPSKRRTAVATHRGSQTHCPAGGM